MEKMGHAGTRIIERQPVFPAVSGRQGMKSTQGGIGVENLQGSGLIAGETSRAYQAQGRGGRGKSAFQLSL